MNDNRLLRWGLAACLITIVGILGAIGYRWYLQVNDPSRQLVRAVTAQRSNDILAAELHLRNYIKSRPNDPGARMMLADIYRQIAKQTGVYQGGDPPQAVEQMEEVIRQHPDHLQTRNRLMLAYHNLGRIKDAQSQARELTSRGTEQTDAWEFLIEHAITSGNLEEADRLLTAFAGITGPDSLRMLALRVRYYSALEQRDSSAGAISAAARADLRHALDLLATRSQSDWQSSNTLELRTVLAMLGTAIRHAESPLETQRIFGQSLSTVKMMLLSIADDDSRARTILLDQVSRHYAAAMSDESPASDSTVTRQAEDQTLVSLRAGNRERFVSMAGPYVGRKATPASLYLQYAAALAHSGQLDQAEHVLQEAATATADTTEATPHLAAMKLAHARYLLASRRFDEARPLVRDLIASQELAPWGLLLSAILATESGNGVEAAELLRKARAYEATRVPAAMLTLQYSPSLQSWPDTVAAAQLIHDHHTTLNTQERGWLAARGGQEWLQFVELAGQLELGNKDRVEELTVALADTVWNEQVAALHVRRHLAAAEWDAAAHWIEEARPQSPDSEELAICEFLINAGRRDVPAATSVLHDYVQSYPDAVRSRLVLAQWIASHGEHDTALQWARSAREQSPKTAAAWLLEARLLFELSRYDQLRTLIQEASQNESIAAETVPTLVSLELRSHDLSDIVTALETTSSALLDTPDFLRLRGEVALASGQPVQAIDLLLGTASTPRSTSQSSRLLSAVALSQLLSTTNEAEVPARLQELINRHPHEPLLQLAAIDIAVRRRDFSTADRYAEQLAHTSFPQRRTRIVQAHVHLLAGRRDKAEPAIDELLAVGRLEPVDRLLLASWLNRAERFEDAFNILKPVSAWPWQESALKLSVVALRQLDRVEDAIKCCDTLLADRSDNAVVRVLKADLLHVSGRVTEALATLPDRDETARLARPQQIAIEISRIRWLCGQQKLSEARDAAQAFLLPNSTLSERLAIARTWMSLSQYSDAAMALDPGTLSAGGDPDPADLKLHGEAAFLLATALHQQAVTIVNDDRSKRALLERAEHAYLTAERLAPDNLAVTNNHIWLLSHDLRDTDRAMPLVRHILEKSGGRPLNADVVDTLVFTCHLAGQIDTAWSILNPSLKRFPENPVLRFHRAELLLASVSRTDKDIQQAQDDLRSAIQSGISKEYHQRADQLLGALSR